MTPQRGNPQPSAWNACEEGYKLLKAAHTRVWLLGFRGIHAGQIRYIRAPETSADIHLFVLPQFRHLGMRSWLVDSTVDLAGTELAVSRVRATMFADNQADRSTFLRSGLSVLGKNT